MGFLKKALGIGLGVKTYQNVFNRPVITPPPGYVVLGQKQKGMGSRWVVTYAKKHQMNVKSTFTISSNTRAMSVGGNKFRIDWP